MKYRRLWMVVLALTLVLVLLPQNAQAATVPYYGRQTLAAMTNGTNLVKAYDAVVTGVESGSTAINIRTLGISISELALVMDAYRRDHTEHFWYDSYKYHYNTGTLKVNYVLPSYTMTGATLRDARNAMEASMENILSGLTDTMTEYEKELYLHDALAKQVTYASSSHAHDAYGALVEGVAVCEGYAEALQVLLHRAGIQSFIAIGYSKLSDIGHAWNYVNIDGSWYHTDLTWNDNDANLYHAYFNMSDAMIEEDHGIDACSYPLPVCGSNGAHYFQVNGSSFNASTYTVAKIAALLKQTPWTANVYITDDTDAFWQWVTANISQIIHSAGAADIGSYGYRMQGREMKIYLTCRHSILTTHAATDGDCMTPGNSLYYSCNACGCILDADLTTLLDEIPYIYRDHTIEDGFCAVCQVVTSDGIHYPGLEAAARAGGSYVRLNFDLDEDAYVPCSVYLDLNGKYISGDLNIANGATVYLFDSATAGYDATYRGKITGSITGTVAPTCNTPSAYGHNYKYLTLEEADGTVSAHRYYLAVRSAILNPYQVTEVCTGSAVNYSIVFKCSDFLATYVTDWGAKFTGDAVVYAEAASAMGGQNTCVTALVGTIKDTNSEEQNLQNAEQRPVAQGYIRLLDGTELVSMGVQKSVKDLVTYANTQTLTLGQRLAMQKMYAIFADLITHWGLDVTKYQ